MALNDCLSPCLPPLDFPLPPPPQYTLIHIGTNLSLITLHWILFICVTSRSMSTYWSHYYIETKCPRNSKAPNPCEVIFCHRSEQLHDHGKVWPAKNYPKLHMTTPVACKLATVQTGKHGNQLANVAVLLDWTNPTNNILTCSCNLVTFFWFCTS